MPRKDFGPSSLTYSRLVVAADLVAINRPSTHQHCVPASPRNPEVLTGQVVSQSLQHVLLYPTAFA